MIVYLPCSIDTHSMLHRLLFALFTTHSSINCFPQLTYIYYQSLSLQGNLLTGEIPTMPSRLRFLSLRSNQLRGNLNALKESKNLSYIYLNGNQFTGPVPNIQIWPRLFNLDVSNNRLTGKCILFL